MIVDSNVALIKFAKYTLNIYSDSRKSFKSPQRLKTERQEFDRVSTPTDNI